MRGWQAGQVGAEFGLVLAFLFAGGLAGLQFLGLALDTLKVAHAAQEAAYVAASLPAADAQGLTPCWAVTGGLTNPGGLGQAPVCRTVVENFGDMDASRAGVRVFREHGQYRVSITYAEPVASPLLRLLLGDTFTTTQDAVSR